MTTQGITIEVAAFTPCAAITAAKAGADRIELCSGYSEGGLSPSAGTIQKVRENISIPLHVMIRPRIGDFVYSSLEKEAIINDMAFCKNLGIDGIVLGALTESGKVDADFVKKVIELAHPMSVTFHRAFDITKDLFEALNELISCGVDRILTSGGKSSAIEGIETISELVKLANDKLIILPGGGINPQNIQDIVSKTGVKEIHFSAKKLVQSPMSSQTKLSLTSSGEVSDSEWYECEAELVRELSKKLDKGGMVD